MDEATEVRQGEELDARKVEAFLRDVVPGLEGEMTIRQFPSGASNLTYLVTLGDPLMDLGGSLAYWVEAGDPEEMQLMRSVPTNAQGALKRRELAALYERLSGRAVQHFDFYLCFGYFKLAVIVQQIYYRFYHGQTQDTRFQAMGYAVGILEKAAMRTIERSKL